MATYDTTATCQEDTYITSDTPNTNGDGSDLFMGFFNADPYRSILNAVLPSKPIGADRIDRLTLVLTYRRFNVANLARVHNIFKLGQNWTEGSATWTNFTSGLAWGTAGGDKDKHLSTLAISSPAYGSSFAYDITGLGLDWAGRGSILIQDSVESGAEAGKQFFSAETVATVAWKPHIVVNFTDNAPDAINDLTVSVLKNSF